MRLVLVKLLRCPKCKSPSALKVEVEQGDDKHIFEGVLHCSDCGSHFPIREGIPHMLPAHLLEKGSHAGVTQAEEQKRQQIVHFDSIGESEIEVTRPHGFGRAYNFLMDKKFEIIRDLWGKPLEGNSVLDVCCGSGMDAEYLVNAGAEVVGIDISIGALRGAQKRAEKFGLNYDLILGDAENLPFQDRALSLSFIHDGLHHLDSPQLGFSEMARVSSTAVLINEPTQTFLTDIAIRLGMADVKEESGNRVHRFKQSELNTICQGANLKRARLNRYLMYYRQTPFKFFKLFEFPLFFRIFVQLFQAANLILGRSGNKIALVAER